VINILVRCLGTVLPRPLGLGQAALLTARRRTAEPVVRPAAQLPIRRVAGTEPQGYRA
jgi:hypothetical protein